MNDEILVSLARIRQIIESYENEFSTIDVLRQYGGCFCSNIGTPVAFSFNAQFGKLLKRNCEALGIEEVKANATAKDDHGHRTSTSIWRRAA